MRFVDRLADKVASSISFSEVTDASSVVDTKVERVGLNVRVPFCALKCAYCAVPGDRYSLEAAQMFLRSVDRELELYAESLGRPKVDRVYVSGGTPSLMHREIGTLVDMVGERFGSRGKVAIEASPTDLSPDVVRNLRDAGVDQISVGVQTFDEGMLASLNRAMKREKLEKSLRTVMDAGFDYVNIDLMFSLRGQTTSSILDDLKTAGELGVHGISVYPLMLLPYTPMTMDMMSGKSGGWVQDPRAEKDQYLAIVSFLRDHGYKLRTLWSFSQRPEEYEGPYEHSNFVGIGPRAWGMVNNKFTLNCSGVVEYESKLEKGVLPLHAYSEVKGYSIAKFARCLYNGKLSGQEIKALSAEDRKVTGYIWALRLLRLMEKTGDGVALTDRAMSYGSHATKKIAMATLTRMDEASGAGARGHGGGEKKEQRPLRIDGLDLQEREPTV
jgi:oxygen-independent coproporphyrinogen-3 oxidase